MLRCIDRKIILLYLDHHVRAMTTLFPPRGSERRLADLTFRFFVPVFFWFGSVTDHSAHTPTTTPFQYMMKA